MDTTTNPHEDENPLDVLRARGFVQDVTDEAALRARFDEGPVTYYVGFDPTAPSLHVGNLVGMMAMSWLQRLGHRPIALAGGATGRIGDPTGRDMEREVMDDATVERHLAGIRVQLGLVLDLGEGVDSGEPQGRAPSQGGSDADGATTGLLVDNHTWTRDVRFLDFLRDVGVHASVNTMISRESVKRRLEEREQGLSYAEFTYQLLQAFDFDHLYNTEGCILQGGGSDQWGNIVAGVDLIRRRSRAQAFGLVWPLIEGSDGKKFSKSAGNAPWLDASMTTPYTYYQWWLNTDDRDVGRFLKLFTFLPVEGIDAIVAEHEREPSKRSGQQRLAAEATRVIHGDEGVAAAERATSALFGGASFRGLDEAVLSEAFDEAPSAVLSRARLEQGIGLLELLTEVGASKSNGEARRLVEQGAVRLNNEPVGDASRQLGPDDLASERTLVFKVGKRRYYLARFH